MLIDWFTVAAQTLNFLILVWLMKHFLYQPVLDAIAGREQKIATALADAAATKAAADQNRDAFQQKHDAFDQERTQLLTTAKDEAKTERERLIAEARHDADTLREKRQEKLHAEAANLHQALARSTQQEVFSIARLTLTDLASADLEEQMVAKFTRDLWNLNGEPKSKLEAALQQMTEPVIVRTVFDLSDEEQAEIHNALNQTFAVKVPLKFKTAPELVSGVELTMNGEKLAWSIADYLTSLEDAVGELLKPPAKPEPTPETETETKKKTESQSETAAKSPAESEPKAVEPTAAPAQS